MSTSSKEVTACLLVYKPQTLLGLFGLVDDVPLMRESLVLALVGTMCVALAFGLLASLGSGFVPGDSWMKEQA